MISVSKNIFSRPSTSPASSATGLVTHTGYDVAGRVSQVTAPTDIDRYQYGYDQNSNRLYKANVVGTAAVSASLDELYAYDPLNRLTTMQRGVLNSTKTAITGTPSVEQNWTLDPTGNWSNFTTKASGTTTLSQTRTANTVNEITNITESTGPTWGVRSSILTPTTAWDRPDLQKNPWADRARNWGFK